MAKKFNLKVLIIILATIIILVSAAGFSVSYAKWVTSGTTTLSANLSTGKWSKYNLNDDKEVLEALENDPNIININEPSSSGDKPQYGGILTDSNKIQGICFYNTGDKDGFTLKLDLEKGDNFVIAIFNRVVDTDNSGKTIFSDGYFEFESGKNYVETNGKIFTAKESGTYTITIKEGGYRDRHDMLTIAFIPA